MIKVIIVYSVAGEAQGELGRLSLMDFRTLVAAYLLKLRQRPCSITMPSNRWSAFLEPRELIFRQPSAGVEYANLVRWIFIPPPENKVMVLSGGARGKAWDKNASLTLTV